MDGQEVDQPEAIPQLPPVTTRAQKLLVVLFGAAAFSGAALLFVVQPLIARLLLPSYGGSSTVWSTSSLFFQVLLLLGYLYAHLSTRRLGRAWQPRLHLLVLLAPIVVLPIALPSDAAPSGDSSPALWLLRTLTLMIGLPFVVVSTTGPLLQKWYSWTDGHRSGDPYFLFAASNLGSFGGLLAYPFVIEPTMTLGQQRAAWSIGFAVFALLTAACGVVAMRSSRAVEPGSEGPIIAGGLGRARVLRWAALAFLPSALMLAVTAHISTDIAAIPLLWVVPLAIYLATFVVAFARQSRAAQPFATKVAVAVGFAAAIVGILPAGPVLLAIAVQLAMLAIVGYVAHARLAADRPDPAHLTTFYLVVAVGGALGGVLNGLVAPTLFDRVLEYPLVMIVIPLLMIGVVDPASVSTRTARLTRRFMTTGLALAALLAVLAMVSTFVLGRSLWALGFTCLLIVACLLGLTLSHEPKLLVVALLVVFGSVFMINQARSIDQSRTFFGSYQVREIEGMHDLVHGTTVHGNQFLDERSTEPTTYYSRGGPLGDIFDTRDFMEVGVIGLGAGTIAAYGQPGMHLTYFEIDPEIVRIAETPEFFTYLRDTAADVEMVVGDGRLEVADQPEGKFDLMVLDAFSSDAIPIHLLTVEAMRTYASRLSEDGILAIHISNKVFDLEPVVAGAAEALGWEGATDTDNRASGDGATPSQWVVITRSAAVVGPLVVDQGWDRLSGHSVTWTDDHSSILNVLK